MWKISEGWFRGMMIGRFVAEMGRVKYEACSLNGIDKCVRSRSLMVMIRQ